MKRLDMAALAVAATVLAGLAFAIRPHHTEIVADRGVTTPTVASSSSIAPRPTLLFIGDSYVAGTGRDETTYGCMAAARMGWFCKVAAGPGTGYISGGPANRFQLEYIGQSTSFDERLGGLALKYQPNVVVLDGGRNDLFAPTDAVYDVMVSTIADVQKTWPDATVVFIRPRFLARPADDLGYDDRLMTRLETDPALGPMLIVIDPIGSMRGQDTLSLVAADKIHPNRRGELAMSSELVDALLAAGFTPAQ